ncbi:MAG TPA: response regulator, partial [Steroidobacteraceae bacterium]|nr:response regulator [Steroidobacteraceae bacterium]
GLGLSMIYGFAKQSEGLAKIYSEVGKGTTVKLYLPRYLGDAVAESPTLAAAVELQTVASESILVVEDEEVVRALIVEVMRELGYRVLEAKDGPTGLAILQRNQSIDLLIADVGLPGFNGRQLAEAARQVRPELKVLFMTGYAENAAVTSGFLEHDMAMITKPFAVETLAAMIRQMLET